MLVLLITIVILIGSAVIEHNAKYTSNLDMYAFLVKVIAFSILCVELTYFIMANISAIGAQAKLVETQTALEYKIKSSDARDKFGLLNKSIIDDVQRYNEYIAYNKALQKDIWIGIFIPNIYDDFYIIDYKKD